MLASIKEIASHRYLLSQLVRKDIKLRYKRSALGFLWSLLRPLLMMAIFTLVFSHWARFANMPVPYYAFLLTGYLPWMFFSTALSNSHTSILANASLVKQVYFPRQLLPLASCLSNLIHFLIAYAMWVGWVLIVFRSPSWAMLLLPVAILLQMALIIGLSLILSAMNVYFRDVGQSLEVVLTFLFFLTPIFYSFDIFPEADAAKVQILQYNPLAQMMMIYRGLLLEGYEVTPFMLGYTAAWAGGTLLIGHAYLVSKSRTLAKEL